MVADNRRLIFPALMLVFAFSAPASLLGQQISKTGDNAEQAAPTPEDQKEYYELLRLFADTVDQIERNYVKPIDRRELMEAAIRGALSKLDPYSNYIGPEELDRFRNSIEAEFGGIGIQVSIDGGRLRVISPLVGTPAYRAGLMAGDHITKIEGESTDGITLDEAVRLMKGKVGTDVSISIRHLHNPKEIDVTLKRAIIQVETVLGDLRDENDRWKFRIAGENHIGYIRLNAFSRNTARDLRRAVQDLQKDGFQGLVIDLRFNPGGLLSSAVEVCDMFISDGKIVSTKGRNVRERTWRAHKPGTFEGFPMAVLINKYSASASEIVSACLQDHNRAVVIGVRSWGKGSVQNVIDLEGGKSALKLTTAGYERPNGRNIHRFEGASEQDEWGVSPNDGYEVKLDNAETSKYLRYRRDRDIVASKTPLDEESSGDEEPSSDDGEDEPSADEEEDGEEGEDAENQDDQEEEEETGQDGDESDEDEAEEDKPADEDAEFVDRQLKKAVDYILERLAKVEDAAA